MRKRPVFPVTKKRIFSALTPEQLKGVKIDNRKSKVILNIAARITKQKPATKASIGRIAQYAAEKVGLKRIAVVAQRRPMNSYRTVNFYTDMQDWTEVSLESGAHAIIQTAGVPFPQNKTEGGEEIIRVKLVPVRQTENDIEPLYKVRKSSDATESLAGSVGYVGFNLKTVTGDKSPSLVVWVIQKRALAETPKRMQKLYSGYASEIIKFLEHEATRLGLSRILVVSADNPSITGFGEAKKRLGQDIMQQYASAQKKLAREGYNHGIVKFENFKFSWPFMQKTLNTPN